MSIYYISYNPKWSQVNIHDPELLVVLGHVSSTIIYMIRMRCSNLHAVSCKNDSCQSAEWVAISKLGKPLKENSIRKWGYFHCPNCCRFQTPSQFEKLPYHLEAMVSLILQRTTLFPVDSIGSTIANKHGFDWFNYRNNEPPMLCSANVYTLIRLWPPADWSLVCPVAICMWQAVPRLLSWRLAGGQNSLNSKVQNVCEQIALRILSFTKNHFPTTTRNELQQQVYPT